MIKRILLLFLVFFCMLAFAGFASGSTGIETKSQIENYFYEVVSLGAWSEWPEELNPELTSNIKLCPCVTGLSRSYETATAGVSVLKYPSNGKGNTI